MIEVTRRVAQTIIPRQLHSALYHLLGINQLSAICLLWLSTDPTQGYHLHNLSQHQTDTHDGIDADVSGLQILYSGAYNIGIEGF